MKIEITQAASSGTYLWWLIRGGVCIKKGAADDIHTARKHATAAMALAEHREFRRWRPNQAAK